MFNTSNKIYYLQLSRVTTPYFSTIRLSISDPLKSIVVSEDLKLNAAVEQMVTTVLKCKPTKENNWVCNVWGG
jgi:hypothetical protein